MDLDRLKRRFDSHIVYTSSKSALVLLFVLLVLPFMVAICKDYPSIGPYGYQMKEDKTGLLYAILWPTSYVFLELVLFFHAIFDDSPYNKVMIYFFRGFMFLHFMVCVFIQIFKGGDKDYLMAYVYTGCYGLCAFLSITTLILLVAEGST